MLNQMSEWVYMAKATELWFHSAHHLTKGTGFSGDHVGLYGMIYTELQEEFDSVAERILGLTNDEMMICQKNIMSGASQLLNSYPSPSNMSDYDIALAAQQIIVNYCLWENNFHAILDEAGILTIGLDDLLSNNASNHERYVYLLQQRAKKQ